MKRFVMTLVAAGVLTTLLAACGGAVGPARLQFNTEPGAIGYSVDDKGVITIGERLLSFRNSTGAYAVTLTGYVITYRSESGGLANGADSYSRGSLNVYVPAGIQCTVPDPVTGCDLRSEGATYGPGKKVTTGGYQLLPVGVAQAHLTAGTPVGWYGEITFTGQDSSGIGFTTTPYVLAIAPPN